MLVTRTFNVGVCLLNSDVCGYLLRVDVGVAGLLRAECKLHEASVLVCVC